MATRPCASAPVLCASASCAVAYDLGRLDVWTNACRKPRTRRAGRREHHSSPGPSSFVTEQQGDIEAACRGGGVYYVCRKELGWCARHGDRSVAAFGSNGAPVSSVGVRNDVRRDRRRHLARVAPHRVVDERTHTVASSPSLCEWYRRSVGTCISHHPATPTRPG
jgi:hypothetical protein